MKEKSTDYNDDTKEILFGLRDKTHDFAIGLDIILHSIHIAENEGYLPPIPEEWWKQVEE